MSRKVTVLLPIVCAIVALFWPLFYLLRAIGPDWAYFDSLSMVVRSSVISYGRFPLHDPWTLGGNDLLANPQTRIFSPLGLLDLLFVPHIANVFSLTVHAALGSWGMASLLRYLGRPIAWAWAGAMMFIGGSWFMLHFTEGHIPYGCLQLMPWVLYGLLRVDDERAQVGLIGLLALFVVDGGMYAFVYSLYVGIAMLAVGLIPLRAFVSSVRRRPWFLPSLVLVFACITLPKMFPMLASLGVRPLLLEAYTLTPWDVARSLFDPDQWYRRHFAGTLWRMHELGCYFGYAATAVLAVGLCNRSLVRAHWRWLLFGAIFIWIGTNWLAPFNPWTVVTITPLLRNAHVQSRLFLFAYIALIIFVTAMLPRIAPRWLGIAVTLVVVLEIVGVTQRQWYRYHQDTNGERRFQSTRYPIEARHWQYTTARCSKPLIYHADGVGCYATYEPATPPRGVTFKGSPTYKGEIYLTRGEGTATLGEVSPGYIAVHYEGGGPATIAINQNRLFGWKVTEGAAIVDNQTLLLTIDMEHGGDVILRYHPRYWPWVAVAYVVGIFGLLGLVRFVRRSGAAPMVTI